MATEAGAYNIAVGRSKNFIFGVHIPWGNSNICNNLLLCILVTMKIAFDDYCISPPISPPPTGDKPTFSLTIVLLHV